MQNTRDNLLDQAEILFSEKGFYGTSINDVAQQLGLTKQGLLHYFPSKAKLYGAVLESASDYLMRRLKHDLRRPQTPRQQIISIITSMADDTPRLVRVSRLLVRELLDNPVRAETSQQWFLSEFLTRMQSVIVDGQNAGQFKAVHPMAFIYQLLGSQQYFIVSRPTLRQLEGDEKFQEHLDNHLLEMRRIVESALFID